MDGQIPDCIKINVWKSHGNAITYYNTEIVL